MQCNSAQERQTLPGTKCTAGKSSPKTIATGIEGHQVLDVNHIIHKQACCLNVVCLLVPPAHRQAEEQQHHQQRNNQAAYLARLHNTTCPYSMEASQQARSRGRQHDSAGKVRTSAGLTQKNVQTLRVPPLFFMICMLSRWLLPFSLSTASTASLAKCSLSCVRIFELQHREVHGRQHEATAACVMSAQVWRSHANMATVQAT